MKVIETNITNRSYQLPLVIFFLFLILLTGCSHLENNKYGALWRYADLRAMDPVDVKSPDTYADIVAVYIKDTPTDVSLRLDLLDLKPNDAQDIVVSIDYEPGGSEFNFFGQSVINQTSNHWDIFFYFPFMGEIRGYDAGGKEIRGLKASVFRDPFLDTIILNISKNFYIPEKAPLNFDIFVVQPSSKVVLDSVESVNSKTLPPPPAPVFIGFWNSFRAYTPAQALRMWDGAHFGPVSSRYGLSHLVEAAEQYDIPIVLFGVGELPSFVALSFLGVYAGVARVSVGSGSFGGVMGSCFWCFFVGSIDYAQNHLELRDDYTLPVDARADIVNAALTGETVILGGDLFNSSWGMPAFVNNVFLYIREHPWIMPVTSLDSKALNTTQESCRICTRSTRNVSHSIIQEKFLKSLSTAPNNSLKDLAWQAYLTMMDPFRNIDEDIEGSYIGQLGHILSAAEWLENPRPISTCLVDLDWDSENECILATDSIYLTFELKGGYLAFIYYRYNDSVHQIAAPMFEVVAGLGDPLTYKPGKGVFSDPILIPGILAIDEQNIPDYEYTIDQNTIRLMDYSGGIDKSFHLLATGIKIDWSSSKPIGLKIPLILDPWVRYEPNWRNLYYKQMMDGIWVWGVSEQIEVAINSSEESQLNTFLDSIEYLKNPEDPNFEYPAGHYLPFPTAVLDISPTGSSTIELNFKHP